jgi:endonuclease/exonuclease/phosphatase (EEP) superfamily protein YafD
MLRSFRHFLQLPSRLALVFAAAEQLGARYIIVTMAVTLSLPPTPSLPWNNYRANSNLTPVYSNNDVRIF